MVFGCGGDRDRGKRPLMGEIAARLADRVIVTSDNPRSEDPEAIIAEILAGIARGRARTTPTGARRSRRRSPAPAPGDVVVIAGKGHEQGQEFAGGRKLPFDDVEVARELLSASGRRTRPMSALESAERVARRRRRAACSPRRRRGAPGPQRATIDSREAGPGALFVGLPGEHAHGGTFALRRWPRARGAC